MKTEFEAKMGEIRAEIDGIDAELFGLLVRRMKCSEEVAKTKKAHDMPIYDAERERLILKNISEKDAAFGKYIAKIYESILKVSKERQEEVMGRKE